VAAQQPLQAPENPMTRLRHTLVIIGIAATTLAPAPQASAKTLKLAGAEGQRASNLCWAASSVTAIRMLLSPEEREDENVNVTQGQLAAYRMLIRDDFALGAELASDPAGIERLTMAQVDSIDDALVEERLNDCKGIGVCNLSNPPILLDMHFDTTDPGEALNWSNIVEQIDSGRPVVFGWDTEDLDAGREFGPHYSLVTGYRTRRNVREVRLWDPWPASASGRGGQHSRWIPYCTYRNPRNVMGVDARHQFDRYNLTRISATGPAQPHRSTPKTITADDDCGPASEDGQLSASLDTPTSIRAVQDAFRNDDRIRETLDGGAIPSRALFSKFGAGLPIVSVSARQITRAEGDADILLVDRANSVLVPVTRGRSTIDSFLVLRDGSRGWVPGGYSNTEAAALLVAERRRQPAGDFYLVSVPSMNAFFLAQGLGAEASLIPIWDDPAIGATAGESRKAEFFFGRFREVLRHRNGPG
jgi:hypothetical protein